MPDCHVLVVEDDVDTREAIVDLLRVEGYAATGAAEGKMALEMLRKGEVEPDVIVLDLYMPTMTGMELRKALQAEPQWKDIPVVLCSGSTAVSVEDVFEVVQKPMDVEALLGVVRRGCAASPSPRKMIA